MKQVFIFFVAVFVFLLGVSSSAISTPTFAVEKEEIAISSAKLDVPQPEEKQSDDRVEKLKNFLKDYPLEDSAADFIKIADKYNLGKHAFLVAAISGVESTFGLYIPKGSYNAWGFGIPTGSQSGIVFNSWEDGIEEVTKTIRTQYLKNIENIENMNKDELVYAIGPIYAASPAWPWKVRYFMEKIENTPATTDPIAQLPLDF